MAVAKPIYKKKRSKGLFIYGQKVYALYKFFFLLLVREMLHSFSALAQNLAQKFELSGHNGEKLFLSELFYDYESNSVRKVEVLF